MSTTNRTICPKCKKPTLKENYEIGINSNTISEFYVYYSAYCNECGFEFDYNHVEIITDNDRNK